MKHLETILCTLCAVFFSMTISSCKENFRDKSQIKKQTNFSADKMSESEYAHLIENQQKVDSAETLCIAPCPKIKGKETFREILSATHNIDIYNTSNITTSIKSLKGFSNDFREFASTISGITLERNSCVEKHFRIALSHHKRGIEIQLNYKNAFKHQRLYYNYNQLSWDCGTVYLTQKSAEDLANFLCQKGFCEYVKVFYAHFKETYSDSGVIKAFSKTNSFMDTLQIIKNAWQKNE